MQTCAQTLDRHTFSKALLDECANFPAPLETPKEVFAECQSCIAIHVRKLQGVMTMFCAGCCVLSRNEVVDTDFVGFEHPSMWTRSAIYFHVEKLPRLSECQLRHWKDLLERYPSSSKRFGSVPSSAAHIGPCRIGSKLALSIITERNDSYNETLWTNALRSDMERTFQRKVNGIRRRRSTQWFMQRIRKECIPKESVRQDTAKVAHGWKGIHFYLLFIMLTPRMDKDKQT